MSLIDDEGPTINSTELIQPVKVETKHGRTIPPDVLIRIFQYLPVPSLAKVALVSRRFKVLVYDDEIWDEKLKIMLENDTGALAAMLGNRYNLAFDCNGTDIFYRGQYYKGILDR
jgi:recyclin-1